MSQNSIRKTCRWHTKKKYIRDKTRIGLSRNRREMWVYKFSMKFKEYTCKEAYDPDCSRDLVSLSSKRHLNTEVFCPTLYKQWCKEIWTPQFMIIYSFQCNPLVLFYLLYRNFIGDRHRESSGLCFIILSNFGLCILWCFLSILPRSLSMERRDNGERTTFSFCWWDGKLCLPSLMTETCSWPLLASK